jgi:hypothetical protein
MSVLKDVCSGRLNPHRVSDWQLVKDGRDRFEQGRREQLLVFRR